MTIPHQQVSFVTVFLHSYITLFLSIMKLVQPHPKPPFLIAGQFSTVRSVGTDWIIKSMHKSFYTSWFKEIEYFNSNRGN